MPPESLTPTMTPSVSFLDVDHAVGDVAELLYDVLYEPYDVRRGDDWLHPAEGGVFAVARDGAGTLLGVARLLPEADDGSRQLRQLAVAEAVRGTGVGRLLVTRLEQCAVEEGTREVWLSARDSAFGFYRALGYDFVGAEFISELTGIPHRRMAKRLR